MLPVAVDAHDNCENDYEQRNEHIEENDEPSVLGDLVVLAVNGCARIDASILAAAPTAALVVGGALGIFVSC